MASATGARVARRSERCSVPFRSVPLRSAPHLDRRNCTASAHPRTDPPSWGAHVLGGYLFSTWRLAIVVRTLPVSRVCDMGRCRSSRRRTLLMALSRRVHVLAGAVRPDSPLILHFPSEELRDQPNSRGTVDARNDVDGGDRHSSAGVSSRFAESLRGVQQALSQ